MPDSLLVAQYRVIYGPIDELIEHLLDLQLSKEFKDVVDKRHLLQETAQMIVADY